MNSIALRGDSATTVTTTFTYDAAGNQTESDDGTNITTYTYSLLNKMVTATVNGTTTTYVYDDAGNRVQETTGGVTTFYLTDVNNPTGYAQPIEQWTSTSGSIIGATHAMTYVLGKKKGTGPIDLAAGQVVTSTDEYGNVTTNTYDSRGLLIQSSQESRNADGTVVYIITQTVYDADGRAILVTDPYLQGTNPDDIFSTMTTYNTLGQVIQTERYEGVDITMAPDSSGMEETAIASTTEELAALAVANTTTTTTYDAEGNVATTFDGFDNETINTYDEAGNLIQTAKQSENANGSAAWVLTRTVYDQYGQAVFTTNPYVATLSDGTYTPTGDVTGTATDYDGFGDVIETDTLDNLTISLTMNSDGTCSNTVATGFTVVSITQTVFNTLGQTVESIGPYAPGNLANAPVTNYEYDSQGQQVAVIYPAAYDAAVGAVVRQRVETQYNGFDGQQSETITNILQAPTGGALSTSGAQTLANGDIVDYTYEHKTQYVYDAFGNLIETIFPDGTTTSTTYNSQNQKVTSTDQMGRTTTYTYDDMGNLASVSLPAVENPQNDDVMTTPTYQYKYDAFGNQVEVIDPLGSTTTYTFDAQGNQLTQTLAMSETAYNYYDQLGRLSLTVSMDGVVCQYVYDNSSGGDGQLEAQNYFHNMAAYDDYLANDGTVPGETVAYTYDALGNTVETEDTFGNGDAPRVTLNTYDQWGNLIEVQSPEGTVGYTYDPVTGEHISTWTGNATSPTTDETYSYDALGRLDEVSAVTLNGTLLAAPQNTLYTYNLDGTLATETLPNGVESFYSYNAVDNLIDLTETTASGTVLADYTYSLALDGTRIGAVETVLQSDGTNSVTTITWTYDADNRLIEENETSTEPSLTDQDYDDQYTYDLAANQLTDLHVGPGGGPDSTTTNTYNANDELLTQAVTTGTGDAATTVTTTFTYDAAGNQIESNDGTAVTTYTYNLLNKMVTATVNGTTTTYVYDDAGNRVQETTNVGTDDALTTFYLTDPNNPTGYAEPIEQWTSATGSITGATHALTYIIGNQFLGQADSSGAITFFLMDGHGSTRLLVNESSVLTNWMNYNAFGAALNFNPATAETDVQFGGDGLYDQPTGLVMHGDGERDTKNAVFIQKDPSIGLSSNPLYLNPYLLDNANPIAGIDPSGTDTVDFGGDMGAMTGIPGLPPPPGQSSLPEEAFQVSAPNGVAISPGAVPPLDKAFAQLAYNAYLQYPTGGSSHWTSVAAWGNGGSYHPWLGGWSGFRAVLYESPDHQSYALVFKGTNLGSAEDWWTDAKQGLDFDTDQYDDAIALAKSVSDKIGDASLTMVGHSLGGGLADAAACATNRPAVTFDAAGLSNYNRLATNRGGYTSNMTNFSIAGQFLDNINGGIGPEIPGNKYILQPAPPDMGKTRFSLHSMLVMLRALQIAP